MSSIVNVKIPNRFGASENLDVEVGINKCLGTYWREYINFSQSYGFTAVAHNH
jgi:hypothetical protein